MALPPTGRHVTPKVCRRCEAVPSPVDWHVHDRWSHVMVVSTMTGAPRLSFWLCHTCLGTVLALLPADQ